MPAAEHRLKAAVSNAEWQYRQMICGAFPLLAFCIAVASAQGATPGSETPAANKSDARGTPSDVRTSMEEVVVSTRGLYGDWRMVLPEWPGFSRPVTGDFCNFSKRGDGVSIICADDFLQQVPEVTFDGDRLRMRWGGAFTRTIYDAVWEGDGTFSGEIVQASMGLVSHRFKAKMERVSEQVATDGPKDSLAILNNYFDDLASKSIREKYYEADVYRSMKKVVATRAWPHAGFAAKYFGRILEQKGGHEATFPDVFKVSSAGNTEQWCLVRIDAEGLADVRCRDIP